MEASPLIKAHDHARAASAATHTSDTTVAINEHAQAAGEFANAATSTSSVEALRTLKLLEEHHRRLSELLKLPLERHVQPIVASEKQAAASAEPTNDDPTAKTEQPAGHISAKSGVVPSLTQQRRPPGRDLTSSIASNLASARGIRGRNRGQIVPPSVTNDQAPGNLEVLPRKDGSRSQMHNVLDQTGKPGWVPPAGPKGDPHRKEAGFQQAAGDSQASVPEDGYSRFYNTFGSIINRLSAPLAFAGLPLIAEESSTPDVAQSPEPSPSKRNRHKSPTVNAEPDLSKIYSRATLRAMSGGNANDSFYVVPTSGGTVSYANILSFADKEKRRQEASLHGGAASILEDDEDDFVDAREGPVPLSPGAKRRVGKSRTERDLNNTIEELYLENKGLKDMLDKLSKRLQAFEASAQSSSLALAESMRLMRPGSPLSSGSGSGKMPPSDDALRQKNQELEEQLALAVERMDLLEKDHQKMQRTLGKYREKWEKLKAGAKARREAQGTADNPEDEAGPS